MNKLIVSEEILNERALHYALSTQEVQIKGEIREYCSIRLGPQWYMVDTFNLTEIFNYKKISILPRAKKGCCGVINVRGNIVLVADIKDLLNIDKGEDKNGKIILTNVEDILTAFVADEILGINQIDTADIKPAPSATHGQAMHLVSGLYQADDKHFALLDVTQLWLAMAHQMTS